MIGLRDHLGHPDALDPVVRTHPLNAGKVAWWLMRPGLMSGTRVVDLMGRHHGVQTNADNLPRWSDPAGRPGGRGSIYLGTGTGSSYVSVPVHPENSLVRDWTYAIWAYPGAMPANQALFSRWQNSGAGRQVFIYFEINGTVHVDIPFVVAVIAGAPADRRVAAGRWNHVAVTRRGDLWTVYVDAEEAATATQAGVQESPTVPMEIGYCTAQSGSQLVGRWDNAAIWNRALSPKEVRLGFELDRAGNPGMLRTRTPPTFGLDFATPVAPLASHFYRRRRAS